MLLAMQSLYSQHCHKGSYSEHWHKLSSTVILDTYHVHSQTFVRNYITQMPCIFFWPTHAVRILHGSNLYYLYLSVLLKGLPASFPKYRTTINMAIKIKQTIECILIIATSGITMCIIFKCRFVYNYRLHSLKIDSSYLNCIYTYYLVIFKFTCPCNI